MNLDDIMPEDPCIKTEAIRPYPRDDRPSRLEGMSHDEILQLNAEVVAKEECLHRALAEGRAFMRGFSIVVKGDSR